MASIVHIPNAGAVPARTARPAPAKRWQRKVRSAPAVGHGPAEALHLTTDAVLVLELDGRVSYANERAARILRSSAEALLGRRVRALVPQATAAIIERAACLGGPPDDPISVVVALGSDADWHRMRVFPGRRAVALFISDLEGEHATFEPGGIADAAFDALPQPTAIVDRRGNITRTNPRWERATACLGTEPSSSDLSCNYFDRCQEAADGGSHDGRAVLAGIRSVLTGAEESFSHDYRSVQGVERHFCVQIVPAGTCGLVITHHEITERVRSEALARHRADHDDLTRLPNRATALQVLRDRIDAVEPTAVLYIDLDGFKEVNDGLGHAAGDHLLEAVARRLEAAARPDELLARLGGDEFLVIVPTSLDIARTISERIQLVLGAPFEIDDVQLTITASIGVAALTDGHHDPDQVVQAADDAMYAAKRAGKDRVAVHRDGLAGPDQVIDLRIPPAPVGGIGRRAARPPA